MKTEKAWVIVKKHRESIGLIAKKRPEGRGVYAKKIG